MQVLFVCMGSTGRSCPQPARKQVSAATLRRSSYHHILARGAAAPGAAAAQRSGTWLLNWR